MTLRPGSAAGPARRIHISTAPARLPSQGRGGFGMPAGSDLACTVINTRRLIKTELWDQVQVALVLLPEREHVRLGAGLQERDLQRPVADGVVLPDELVQAGVPEQAVPVLADIDAV
jgi:hypothetical protein